jgi:hypothetical protein
MRRKSTTANTGAQSTPTLFPPNMRLAAFDSAVNQGVGQTKTWLKEAGGDLQAFMRLRVQKYADLARQPKYAKYARHGPTSKRPRRVRCDGGCRPSGTG